MQHILAMVDSNSNRVECHNSFDPTREDFNDEDPGEGMKAFFANKKEDSQTTYKDDDYKQIEHFDPVYQGIHDMKNREEFGQSITYRMFLEATQFTGSAAIHSFGID